MDQHGNPKGPKDTGERILDAVRRAAARDEEMRRRDTPAPSDSAAQMYEIAGRVVERAQPAHMRHCETHPEGPVCRLGNQIDGRLKEMNQRIDGIETAVETINRERAEERGASREIAQAAGRTAALRSVAISAALSLLVGLGMFAINRLWPANAHAGLPQAEAHK